MADADEDNKEAPQFATPSTSSGGGAGGAAEEMDFSALCVRYLPLRDVSPELRDNKVVLHLLRMGVTGAWGVGALLIEANSSARFLLRSAANAAACLSCAEGARRGSFAMVTMAADCVNTLLFGIFEPPTVSRQHRMTRSDEKITPAVRTDAVKNGVSPKF